MDKLEAIIESKEEEIALARKKGKPNFTLGLSYVDMKDVRNEPRTGALLNAAGATSRLAQPQFLQTPILTTGTTLVDRVAANADFRKTNFETNLNGAMDANSLVELENALDNAKMKDEVMVTVGMNLPIWRSKIRAGVEEAQHMKSAAQHDKRRAGVELEGAAKMAIYGIQDGYRRLKLYDEKLLPEIKRTYETIEGAYAAGNAEGGFLDVLTTLQTKLEFEEQRAEAMRDIHLAAADLEYLLGGPWAATDSGPAPETKPAPSPEGTAQPPAPSPEPSATR